MLSVGTIHYEDRIGGGEQVSARGAIHMAAALAGFLVGTGLSTSLPFDTNRRR